MPGTNTSRTVPIGHDVGPVEYRHALLRFGDRPNESYVPATANEHATLMPVESFTTAQSWLPDPLLRAHTAAGVELVVRVVTAPGGGETLTAILDHYSLEQDDYVAAEILGTIGATGSYLYQSVLSLTGLWRLRLLPSASGAWEAGAGYAYLQAPGPGYPVGRLYTGDERGRLALAVFKPFGAEALVPDPEGLTPLQADGDGALYVKINGTVPTSGGGIGAIDTEILDDVAPVRFPLAPGNEQTRDLGDPLGVRFVHPHPPHIWQAAAQYVTQQTNTQLRAAPGAGYALYLTDVYLQAKAAVDITLTEDGAAGLLFAFYATQAGDGVSKSFRVPIKLPDDTALLLSTSGGVAVTVAATGFVSYASAV